MTSTVTRGTKRGMDLPNHTRKWGALYPEDLDARDLRIRCHSCHRHFTNLRSFGGPGDPCVGDFSGAVLIKRWRPSAPILSQDEKQDYLTKYGQAAFDNLEDASQSIGSTWECRDCVILESDTKWAAMAYSGEPVFPWADLEECKKIREEIRKQDVETQKEKEAGRTVVITFKEEVQMEKEGTFELFCQRLSRENRRLIVTVDPEKWAKKGPSVTEGISE